MQDAVIFIVFHMRGAHGSYVKWKPLDCCCRSGLNRLVDHSVMLRSNCPYAKLKVPNLSQRHMLTLASGHSSLA